VIACLFPGVSSSGAEVEAEPEGRFLFDAARSQVGPGAGWAVRDAAVSVVGEGAGGGVRVEAGGGRDPWPGITLPAPEGRWDLSAFGRLEVALWNPARTSLKVFCRVDNPGADGRSNCVTGELSLEGGAAGVLRIPLRTHSGSTLGGRLFGMRGYPVDAGGAGTLDLARVTQVLLFLHQPAERQAFGVRSIRAVGRPDRITARVTDAEPYLPFIDRLGQYRHRDWPGKAAGEPALVAHRKAEEQDLAARPGPSEWNGYGGWAAGPQLEATGFFRTEKRDGRWWLVDPDGRLFWSHGVDCVGMLDVTPVEGREAWYEGLPGPADSGGAHFREAARALKGHYAGRSPRSFCFAGFNLERKYGTDWRQASAAMAHRRLRAWGMNTVANWSDAGITAMRRTPYTDSIDAWDAPRLAGSEGYWGQFPDVFDPGFERGLRRRMETRRGRSAGDPWCLGYFSDNELSWGDEFSLAEAALRSPPEQAGKQAFIADLRRRHTDIEALNRAWGSAHASWDALLAHRGTPNRGRAETYFRTVRDVIRGVAPRQLYLGCRFAWVNARAAAAAARYCDVVSFNLYQRSIADFRFPGGVDVPLIVGEFHFGALDRGMFHTGLVAVGDQDARAAAYREYVEGALRHPQCVGTHWFQWQDEPTTGRVWDEENYQIGLVDIADTPYRETVDAVRAVGLRMYRLRSEGR
jgi:hypothetical protein